MPTVNRQDLLKVLPPFSNRSILIESNQDVPDIIKEVIEAHNFFKNDYNAIWEFFYTGNVETTCKKLFDFCKRSIKYVVEGEHEQTTKSPSAILALAFGDCKHYAGFIGGVLSAINRNTGAGINWRYRFASYNMFDKDPGHVFIVVKDGGGNEFWIDPVLNYFNERLQPDFVTDKKIKDMPLYRVSGVGEDIAAADILPDLDYQASVTDENLSSDLIAAIDTLFNAGILDSDGNINDPYLESLAATMPESDYSKLVQARYLLSNAALSGIFSDIWRGVKKVTLAVPRGAYLALVSLNVFGLGTKIKEAAKTTAGANAVRNAWYKFGGDWAKLRGAADQGATKRRIMGIGEAVTLSAVIASAAAIIAALTPLINSILRGQQQAGTLDPNFDVSLINNTGGVTSTNPVMDFIKNNTLLVALGAGGAIWYFTKSKRKVSAIDNRYKILIPVGAAVAIYFLVKKSGGTDTTVPIDPTLENFPTVPTPTPETTETIKQQYPDGTLLSSDQGRNTYIMMNGQRHYIISADVFNNHGYIWSDIKYISPYDLERIPEGGPLTA